MHTVSLRYTSCWFDTFIDCKMITSTVLANTAITSHIYWLVCVCVWWEHLRSVFLVTIRGFPGGARGKVRAWQGGDLRSGFNPGVRKIPWRRNWQPTSVFLSEKSHGQRVQEGYSSWGCKEWDPSEWLSIQQPSSIEYTIINLKSLCCTLDPQNLLILKL